MKTLPKIHQLVLASIAVAFTAASGASMAQTPSTPANTAGTGMAKTAPATQGMANHGEQSADAATHIAKASQVLQQMQRDQALAGVLNRAKGVFVVPDYGRAALGVGARGGAGVLLVRRGGAWTNPAFYNMGGISVGLQAGVEAGAIAFVLNDQKALNSFMQNNKFSLNGDAGLTLVNWSAKGQGSAGRGDITVWSDTEGLFGSAAISVTDINFDEKETAAYYKRQVAARDVVSGAVRNPNATALQQALAGIGSTTATDSMGRSGTGTTSSGNMDMPAQHKK